MGRVKFAIHKAVCPGGQFRAKIHFVLLLFEYFYSIQIYRVSKLEETFSFAFFPSDSQSLCFSDKMTLA